MSAPKSQSLSSHDLQKLAELSRLSIQPEESEALLKNIQSIVEWVGALSAVPTEGVMPMAHPHDVGLRLREDEALALPPRDQLLANAPAQAGGLFLVPRVIE
ncbi:MAG: Asp-tRNA(Asn)/Glu-tRNA(Gln) amidotransferase subunit GatC [Betaproteobacteria bacterium]|nr:Asp-tRNA(Asn)/Glu-tRNA(Gln) amidotransferase subunit GatC [Betaproteobacteria bacterium]NBY14335.1 Asp-tRNA(Asn)/Glu-tRNA(Gln) amidotransferase subunit GatC [Betaproteobacteria bacterium]